MKDDYPPEWWPLKFRGIKARVYMKHNKRYAEVTNVYKLELKEIYRVYTCFNSANPNMFRVQIGEADNLLDVYLLLLEVANLPRIPTVRRPRINALNDEQRYRAAMKLTLR